jgi:minor extracellular serine protease Vpr
MKKIYTSIAFAIFGISIGFGQVQQNLLPTKVGEPSTAISVLPSKGFSSQSAFLLMELDKIKKENRAIQSRDSILIDKYSLFYIGNQLFVNSFLIVNDDFDKTKFESKGGFINTTSNGIATASIPVNRLNETIEVEGIIYVQIAEKTERTMDAARNATWVNWVHQGQQLPQAYFGTGVVVGIIDKGFDYTHPNFYDGTGANNYRVKRVWEQSSATSNPPSGFSYGRELTTQTAIINAQRDEINQSHGTHVAGIAGGAGGGANTTFMGVAPQSDLVFVSTNMTDLGIADGIAYIINYASSVNKPCVINMSLGKHIGPHDGLSAFDQYCDGIVGNGKILVGAAGNEGGDPLYIGKTYTSSDNTLYSFVQFPNSSNGTNGQTVIDIWGNPNQNYQVAVNIYNTNTNSFEDWTPYIQANSNNTFNYTLYDDDTFVPDACNVTIATSLYPANNKRNVQILIDHTAQDDSYRWAMVEIIASTGQTKMWASTGGARFTNASKPSPWLNGSTSSTIGEIGGTGNSIISVGAYTSKNSWTAFNSSSQTAPAFSAIGAIAPFSSKGPTADNRTKPDITAPGNILASSVSRFDNSYTSSSGRTVSGVTNGTNTWYFGMMEGTSMASPMVTGILALWLQAYPHLNPTQALNLIKQNAWTDSYTGTIPSTGNNTWGWGKVDAHEGLLDLLTKIPAQPTINPSGNVAFCQGQNAQLSATSGFTSYQWSNNATTQNITVSTGGSYTVRVTNNQGYISPWSAPKNVTVHQNPPTPNITINGNVLTSSSTTGNQWYLNGNLISGATQQNYTAQQNGNYHVVVTNANNCSAQSNTLAFTTVGIADLERVGVTSVYPNPTNGLLNIQFSDNQQDVQLEIYDVSGRVHIQKRVMTISQNSVETLNLVNLTTGVYTLRILTNENQATFRIVVTK